MIQIWACHCIRFTIPTIDVLLHLRYIRYTRYDTRYWEAARAVLRAGPSTYEELATTQESSCCAPVSRPPCLYIAFRIASTNKPAAPGCFVWPMLYLAIYFRRFFLSTLNTGIDTTATEAGAGAGLSRHGEPCLHTRSAN